ncbi:outer membrane protein assembly factor BamB/predicted Ser/Thr protein kinase [Streptomyces umbrinus]|uniref:Outer membrane protein assembly factor BamB/predicted Ser/Thr protein kinase n=1 Tax=Streptomyces umbrinus TaxID=67370 RepID=A0ABU0SMC5_9ACTN|nr:PQQ-binding-like beta-propeller repeat protein [Streptomyces umbrinus]MDQ1024706.1 outer membrane protein assembly factor BamB/predicted Ser/Thr protein kinase [Streptomyces umbrinus]
MGGYRLESRLGAGGMGVVYRASSASGRPVALKVIGREWAEDPEFRARFELEVAAARMVHSEFTAPIVDADPHAPAPWMASQYIPGESLAARVRERGPLNAQEFHSLAKALARGLRDIHRAGVVHRDLKPGNILLSERGPLIIDFGVSRAVDGKPLTAAGQIVGTPAYMAPEQFTAPSEAGPAADVFSLGCVLVFAATEHSPFEANSPVAAAYRGMHEEPDLRELPDAFRSLVAACLHKAPDDRPSLAQVLAELDCPERQRKARITAVRTLRTATGQWLTRRVPAWMAGLTALTSGAVALAAVAIGLIPAGTILQKEQGTWETSFSAHGDIRRCALHGAIYCVTEDGSVTRVDTDDGRITWTSGFPREEARVSRPPHSGVVVLGATHGRVITAYQRAREDDGAWQLLDSRLSVLDADTGRRLWTRLIPHNSTPFDDFPAAQLAGSTLYITDLAKAKPEVQAIDVATRDVRWRRTLQKREVPTATPHGLYTIRETQQSLSRRPQRTVITALDSVTGHAAWSITQDEALTFAGSAPGAVYLVERHDKADVTSGDDGGIDSRHVAVVRLDTSTRTHVRVPVPGVSGMRLSVDGFRWAGEGMYGIADDDTFYLRDDSGKTIAVDSKSKKIRWKVKFPMQNSTPTLFGHRLYYSASNGSITALDSRTGQQDWHFQPPHPVDRFRKDPLGPVTGANGRLYAISNSNSLFMAETGAVP